MLALSTTAPNFRSKFLTKSYLQNLGQKKLKNIKLLAIIFERQGRIYRVFKFLGSNEWQTRHARKDAKVGLSVDTEGHGLHLEEFR